MLCINTILAVQLTEVYFPFSWQKKGRSPAQSLKSRHIVQMKRLDFTEEHSALSNMSLSIVFFSRLTSWHLDVLADANDAGNQCDLPSLFKCSLTKLWQLVLAAANGSRCTCRERSWQERTSLVWRRCLDRTLCCFARCELVERLCPSFEMKAGVTVMWLYLRIIG